MGFFKKKRKDVTVSIGPVTRGLCLTKKNCFYIMNYKFERKFMKSNEISEDHVNPRIYYSTFKQKEVNADSFLRGLNCLQ